MISDLKFQILIEYIEFIHNTNIYCIYIYISTYEQSFFLQVKIYMKVDLHMVGCRQFAGVRRLA